MSTTAPPPTEPRRLDEALSRLRENAPRWAKATLPGAEFPSCDQPSKSSQRPSLVALMPLKRSAKSSGFVACRCASS
jgi:hypothetical protein